MTPSQETAINKNEVLKGIGKDSFNHSETLQVLQANRNIFWSWGVSQMTVLPLDEFKQTKALFFKVSARRHKGFIIITLDWNDTYIVTLVSNKWQVKETFESVYFDQLVEIIDDKIERIPAYKD